MYNLDFSLIGKPSGNHKIWKAQGSTTDIMDAISFADKKSGVYTKDFARQLQGLPVMDIAKALWNSLKTKITYREDGLGVQDIKSPGALWESKTGDCKSFSVFTGSVLQNLDIPYAYRYAGYQGSSTYRHVYIVIPTGNNSEIIIDGVWDHFNSEKPYAFKKDIKGMTKISYIGSIGSASDMRIDLGNIDVLNMTDGQLDLLLAADAARDNYKLAIMNGDDSEAQAFAATHDALIATVDTTLGGAGMAGIGCLCEYQTDIAEISGLGSWLKKAVKNVGNAIKKGAQTVAKVATAPLRLAVKGILEIILPKAAPFFAYAYLPDSALSSKGKRKKKKAQSLQRFVTNVIGMKSDHFYKIIDRGVHKRLGVSIKGMVETKKVAGIGAVPAAAAVVKPSVVEKLVKAGPDILGALGELLQKIFSVFKKKDESISNDDLPSDDDFTKIIEQAAYGGGSTGGGGATGSWDSPKPQTASSKSIGIIAALAIGGALLYSNKKK